LTVLVYVILNIYLGAQQLVAIAGSFLFLGICFTTSIHAHLTINMKKIHRLLPFGLLFVAMAVTFIIIVPPLDGLFVEWHSIPILNWFRFFASLIVIGMLPGYAVLSLLNLKDLDPLETLILSFGISLFLTPFFVVILFKLVAPELFRTSLIIISVLLSMLVIFAKHMHKSLEVTKFIRLDLSSSIFLLTGILTFLAVSWLYIDTSNAIYWDVAPTYAGVLSMIKGVYPYTSGYMFTQAVWYQLWLLGITLLSGLPPINVRTLTIVQSLLYPLAYYLLVRSLVGKNSKIPALASVFFTLFGGLGWIQAVGIKQGSNQWLEVVNRTYKLYPIQPLAMLTSLTVLFVFLYLVVNESIPARSKIILGPLLIWALYLLHVAEVFYALTFLAILVLWTKGNDARYSLAFLGSIASAILLIPAYDLLIAEPAYVFNTTTNLLVYLAYAGCAVAILAASCILMKFSTAVANISSRECSKYLFFMSLVIILGDAISRTGIVGVLALLVIPFLLTQKDPTSRLYSLVIFSYSILVIAGYLAPLVFGLYETRRILDVADAWLSILGAYGLICFIESAGRRLRRMKFDKAVPLMCFIFATFLLGLPNTVFVIISADYASPTYGKAFIEEVKTLDIIWQQARAGDSIFAISDSTYRLLGYYTGLKYYNQFEWPLEMSFLDKPLNLESLLQFVSGDPKWIYLREYDLNSLSRKDKKEMFLATLIDHLPVVYNSSETAVYYMPRSSPPSYQSIFAIVTPPPTKWNLNNYFYPIMMAALACIRYSVVYDLGKIDLDRYYLLLITSDLYGSDVLNWVKRGGTAIILPGQSSIPYSDLASLWIANYSSSINGIAGANYTIKLPYPINFSRFLFTSSPETKVVSWYTNNGSHIAPFILERRIENGKILFVDLLPYFEAIRCNKELFSNLHFIIGILENILEMKLERYPFSEKWSAWPDRFAIENRIHIEGRTYINSSQIFINLPLHLDRLEISNLADEEMRISVDAYNCSTLTKLELNGRFSLVFDSPDGQIVPFSGAYVNITSSSPFNLTLKLWDGSVANITFQYQDRVFNSLVTKGEVKLIGIMKNSSIVLMQPSFITEGKITFGRVFAYHFSKYGESLKIDGRVKFRIYWSDRGLLLAGDFSRATRSTNTIQPLLYLENQ